MKNKGFTLIELLAILSIIGVIAVILVPTMLRPYYNARKKLNSYEFEELEDAGKFYVIDLDNGIIEYTYKGEKGETIEINGKKITSGTVLSTYVLRTYLINVWSIKVTA